MSTAIDDVERALADKNLGAALSRMRDAWEERRDPVIADAIDRVSARARASFTPPAARTNAAFQKAWLELASASDPVGAAWLAETLIAKIPRGDGGDDIFVARLRALREAKPDPRLARGLLALSIDDVNLARWQFEELAATVARLGDGRTRAAIEALIAGGEGEAWQEQGTLEKLPAVLPVAPTARARWEALASDALAATTAVDPEALTNAVFAAPDDDGARAVLADCLQSAGDPRGELIAIQLAEAEGHASPEATKRADALLKEHKRAWLGPFVRVCSRATFRRGFIAELVFEGTWKASKKAWAELAKDPRLATVESIGGKVTPDIFALFFASDAMRSLRTVDVDADAIVDALAARRPQSLREVRSPSWKRKDHVKQFTQRVLPLLDVLPSVHAVGCTDETFDALRSHAAFARLSSVEVDGLEHDDAVALFAELPSHIRELRWGWGQCKLARTNGGVALELYVEAAHMLERSRNPYGVPDVLARAAKWKGLTQVKVIARPAKIDTSVFGPLEKKGVKVTVEHVPARSGVVGALAR
jgi:uncharacterized protein (TIGR02996 family)